jgi:RNA polymerase sigma-70 factor (ECF subfamily)
MDREFITHAEACRSELFALCRALLWEKGDLEDAVQEVLIQALRAYPRFEAGTNFKRWFFRVATLTIYNLNRKRRPVPSLSPEPEAERSFEAELLLEDSYDSVLKDPDRIVSSLGEPLRRSMENLNETERAVFLLRGLGDLKYSDIAEALDIPIGSVMGNLARARTKLRKSLAEVPREM